MSTTPLPDEPMTEEDFYEWILRECERRAEKEHVLDQMHDKLVALENRPAVPGSRAVCRRLRSDFDALCREHSVLCLRFDEARQQVVEILRQQRRRHARRTASWLQAQVS